MDIEAKLRVAGKRKPKLRKPKRYAVNIILTGTTNKLEAEILFSRLQEIALIYKVQIAGGIAEVKDGQKD